MRRLVALLSCLVAAFSVLPTWVEAQTPPPGRTQEDVGPVAFWLGSSSDSGDVDADGFAARFTNILSCRENPSTKEIFITDYKTVRKANPTSGSVTTVYGSQSWSGSSDVYSTGSGMRFLWASSMAFSSGAFVLYVSDVNSHSIRQIQVSSGTNKRWVGTGSAGTTEGTGTAAALNRPYSITFGSDPFSLYVCELGSHRLRKIEAPDAITSNLAGSPGNSGYATGTGTGMKFDTPSDFGFDATTSTLVVADQRNNRLRAVYVSNGAGYVIAGSSTSYQIDGTGTAASLGFPDVVAVHPTLRYAYFSEFGNSVRRVHLDTKVVTTVINVAGLNYHDSADLSYNAHVSSAVAMCFSSGATPILYIASKYGVSKLDPTITTTPVPPTTTTSTTPVPTTTTSTTPVPTTSTSTTPVPSTSTSTTPAPSTSTSTTPAPSTSTSTTPAPPTSTSTTPAPSTSTSTTPAPSTTSTTQTPPTSASATAAVTSTTASSTTSATSTGMTPPTAISTTTFGSFSGTSSTPAASGSASATSVSFSSSGPSTTVVGGAASSTLAGSGSANATTTTLSSTAAPTSTIPNATVNVTSFPGSSTPPTTAPTFTLPPGSNNASVFVVSATFTIDGALFYNISLNATAWSILQSGLVLDIAGMLGIDASRITITSMRIGSLIIEYQVVTASADEAYGIVRRTVEMTTNVTLTNTESLYSGVAGTPTSLRVTSAGGNITIPPPPSGGDISAAPAQFGPLASSPLGIAVASLIAFTLLL